MAYAKGHKSTGGRSKLDLDVRQIRELASIQCTMSEIAAVMGCHRDTLTDNYSAIINEAREDGKGSLRRAQYNKAVKDGNPAMLIWLGKHYLEQREEVKLTSTNEPEVIKLMKQIEAIGTGRNEKRNQRKLYDNTNKTSK